jgi:tetratricopeptide (TPR) repeat protein
VVEELKRLPKTKDGDRGRDGASGGAAASKTESAPVEAGKARSRSRPAMQDKSDARGMAKDDLAAPSASSPVEREERAAAPAYAPPPPPKAPKPSAGGANVDLDGLGERPAGAPAEQGDWADQALREGIAAVQRGAFAEAIHKLEPVAAKGTAAARTQAGLWLARSYRGQGNYAKALHYYEPLVRSANASVALLREAADCHEQAGDMGRARELRARAQGATER